MATKAIVLSGIAAFGLGLFGLGAVVDEPGGDAPRAGRVAPAVEPALHWDAWAPPKPAAGPGPAAAPEPLAPVEILPEDRTTPTDVWATPAEWSPAV